jgi:hypothetical protein
MSDSAMMCSLTNHIFGFRFSMMSFPVPFEATDVRTALVSSDEPRYHNSFLISFSRPTTR